jgi:hypothetical protein
MKIGISINDVLRAYTEQISYVYGKYMLYGLEEGVDSKDTEKLKEIQDLRDRYDVTKNYLTDFDLVEYFDFEDVSKLNDFLYREASLEIFGHADELHNNLMSRLNAFAMDIEDDEEHELELVSRDVYKSIPATHFFLSKTACMVKNMRFVNEPEDKWDGLDVLVTANPKALKSKPDGKIAIKIKTTYNEDVDADYSFDTLIDMINGWEELEDKMNSINAE